MTKADMMGVIAGNIRETRVGAGMSMAALAGRCGIPKSHISRMESGRRLPTIETLARVAAGLRVSPRTLLKGI